MSILLTFADGSVGTVNYFANGCKRYPKETLEVFCDGRIVRLENFRVTRTYGFGRDRTFKTRRQDKGHMAEIQAFVDRVAGGGDPLIPYEELANVTRGKYCSRGGGKRAQSRPPWRNSRIASVGEEGATCSLLC